MNKYVDMDRLKNYISENEDSYIIYLNTRF